MLRAPTPLDPFPDSSRKSIRTVKGTVVYGRKKHEMGARDVLRMARRLPLPTKVHDCEAQWDLLRVALDQTEAMLPMDSAFMVRVETQRQVWEAMRLYVGVHPECFGVGDPMEGVRAVRARTWWDRWFPGLVNPLKP